MDDVNMYVEHFGLRPQGEQESALAFRERVAGELRNRGRIIEAHEVQQGRRWDDDPSGAVREGVMGAVGQAFYGRDYHVSGSSQVGADMAAGGYLKHKKPEPDFALLMLAAAFMRR